jgi:hypothetical protein
MSRNQASRGRPGLWRRPPRAVAARPTLLASSPAAGPPVTSPPGRPPRRLSFFRSFGLTPGLVGLLLGGLLGRHLCRSPALWPGAGGGVPPELFDLMSLTALFFLGLRLVLPRSWQGRPTPR